MNPKNLPRNLGGSNPPSNALPVDFESGLLYLIGLYEIGADEGISASNLRDKVVKFIKSELESATPSATFQ